MTYLRNRIICEHWDSVYTTVTLIRREDARCRRCYAVLRRSAHLSNQQLALTMTAALLFIAANVLAHGAPGPIAEVACHGDAGACPRCDSAVLRRKPESLARTWAFLLTALIFYIRANTLTVMLIWDAEVDDV